MRIRVGPVVLLLLLGAAGGAAFWLHSVVAPALDREFLEELVDYRPPLSSVVLDRNGRRVGEFFVQRRRMARLGHVPRHVVDAVLASEDARFFEHSGVDPMSIGRALWANIRGGRIEQGASTITQQVVKNLLLTPERSWTRKIQEIAISLRVEQELSKEQILLLYLNHIYFGFGAYGIGEAARCYFGKDIDELDVSEAALLAGLPQRPTAYQPNRNPRGAEVRRRYVLRRMKELGFLSDTQAAAALASTPELRPPAEWEHFAIAASFTEQVRRTLVELVGARKLHRGGLVIETTLDLDLQRSARQAVRRGLENVDRRQGYRGPLDHIDAPQVERVLGLLAEQNGVESRLDLIDVSSAVSSELVGLVTAVSPHGDITASFAPGVHSAILPSAHAAVWRPTRGRGALLRVGDVARFRFEAQTLDAGDAPLGPRDETPLLRSEADATRLVLHQEPKVEGALLSIDVESGDVLAMVGGYDFERSQYNRAVQSRRQPGSAFKPLIYAAAIERGLSQASPLMDVPYVYRNDTTGATWRPQNYTRRFSGRITLREALARSINNATIRVARRLGVRRILNLARRLGIRSPLGRDLSLSLGTSGVSLLELTEAYAAFPSGGLRVQAHFISRVVDRDGSVLYEDLPLDRRSVEPTPVYGPEAPVLSPPAAGVMTDLLRGAVFDPYATGARARSLGRDVAGKTGTTSGYRDAWFVGFSPTVATGVWVGHDRPISMGHGETGSRAALPIWVEYMEAALRDRPVRRFERRPGVVYRRVDHDTGLLADVSTRRSYWAAFVAGSQPRQAAAPVRERARARRMARWTLF